MLLSGDCVDANKDEAIEKGDLLAITNLARMY